MSYSFCMLSFEIFSCSLYKMWHIQIFSHWCIHNTLVKGIKFCCKEKFISYFFKHLTPYVKGICENLLTDFINHKTVNFISNFFTFWGIFLLFFFNLFIYFNKIFANAILVYLEQLWITKWDLLSYHRFLMDVKQYVTHIVALL